MAETTDVYGLTKPSKTDYYDVGVFNDNADIVDDTLNDIQNNGGVGTSGLAALSVTTAKIASLAVTSAKLSSSAVTTAKIASLAVTNAKIADEAVTEGKIADSAVTEDKIADEAVTEAKLAEAVLADIETRKAVYASCTTNGDEATKAATISSNLVSDFALKTGAHVTVHFKNAHTGTSIAELKVGDTGSSYIKANGTYATADNAWSAGETVEFVYNSAYWIAIGSDMGWIGNTKIAELQEEIENLQEEATTTSAGLMSASDKAKLDSFSESALPVYSTNETIVGEWLDGSNVYRRAFCRELSDAEISAGYVEVRALIEGVSTVTSGSGGYFTVNEHVMFVPFLDGAASPDVLDDRYVALSSAGRYEIPSSNLDGIYGYIDYVVYNG